MIQLIQFEFLKLLQKKIVYVGLVLLFLFNAFMIGNGIIQNTYISGEQGQFIGKEAIKIGQEVAEKYEGKLTEEKIQQILHDFKSPFIEYSYYGIEIPFFYNFANEDGTRNEVKIQEVFRVPEESLTVGYSSGWVRMLNSMGYMMIAVGFFIILAISPVFSEEYSRGMDALILTSRYGKKKGIHAKIVASFVFSFLLLAIINIANAFVYYHYFGMAGFHASIQINCLYGIFQQIPYEMTCLQGAGYAIFSWIISSLILTSLVLLVSALCKTSFISLAVSLFLYIVPIFIQTNNMKDFTKKVFLMNPIRINLLNDVMKIEKLNLGSNEISYIWLQFLFMLLFMVLAWIFSKRTFAKHQVM